jgi:hypothetical protein
MGLGEIEGLPDPSAMAGRTVKGSRVLQLSGFRGEFTFPSSAFVRLVKQ